MGIYPRQQNIAVRVHILFTPTFEIVSIWHIDIRVHILFSPTQGYMRNNRHLKYCCMGVHILFTPARECMQEGGHLTYWYGGAHIVFPCSGIYAGRWALEILLYGVYILFTPAREYMRGGGHLAYWYGGGILFSQVWGGWNYRNGPGARMYGWATALTHAFGWVGSTLVAVGLCSWGWGLASLPSLHSLAWNCALGVGG